MTLFLFSSCGEEGKQTLSGADNPLSEWTIPVPVKAAGEGVVQWNGFTADARLLLVGSDSAEHPLEITALTASGVSFLVPSDVPEGVYMLVLEQGGRTELGEIRVLAQDVPVSGVKVPSDALQGAVISIAGIGFEEGCSVILVDAAGQEHNLEAALTYEGLSVVLPESLAEGKYSVYLLQDGSRWLLSDSFRVYAVIVEKTLAAVRYYSPYDKDVRSMLEWTISDEVLTVSSYIIEAGQAAELSNYDRYVSDGNGGFVLEYDGFEASNDLAMTYHRDQDGRVVSTDVLIYGNDQTTPFSWNYDADGFVTDITSPKLTLRRFEYQDGNLTLFRVTSFEYEQDGPVNHASAPDVVWGYMSLVEKNDPFVYFPYLLGWYTKASAQLPVRMVKQSPTGTGTYTCALSYTFDQDGYVTSMEWSDAGDEYTVEYIYR